MHSGSPSTASIRSAARTPWVARHGPLASTRPETLLAAAVDGAVREAGFSPAIVDRVLVACDVGVGAQDLNLGRRALVELGWPSVPALTVDGQGTADLGLVDIAGRLGEVVVVAAVDLTSTVPPGAGLVRDYGRPLSGEPEVAWLDGLARAAHLTPDRLDEIVEGVSATRTSRAPTGGLVAVGTGRDAVAGDVPPGPIDEAELPPLVEDGVQTARHLARLADGAAAVVVAPGEAGRAVETRLVAGPPDAVIDELRSQCTAASRHGPVLVAESSAVVAALVSGCGGTLDTAAVAAVLAAGSTPSADGLRMLVDAFHGVPTAVSVLRRGMHGQLAMATLRS